MYVFGKNPVLELIDNKTIQINKIWISENLSDKSFKDKIISFAKENKVPFILVPTNKLSALVNGQNHQGVVLNTSPVEYLTLDEIIKDASSFKEKKDLAKRTILIANEIQDPHNLGAIIRTYAAGGGRNIILAGKSNVGLNPTVVKASAGGLFHINFTRATNCNNVISKLKENEYWIFGTDNSSDAKSIYEIDFPDKVALIVGNEHEGLSQLVKKNCDFLIKIPISESVDSLNVSVAFGVIFFEIIRRHALIQPIP